MHMLTRMKELAAEMKRICDFSFDSPADLEAFLFEENAL